MDGSGPTPPSRPGRAGLVGPFLSVDRAVRSARVRRWSPGWFLLLAVGALLGLSGCGDARSAAGPPPPADLWRQFSGERAYHHVAALVDFGPHPSGSENIEKVRAYLEAQLRGTGWQVERQSFVSPTPRGPVTFVNLVARRADAKPDAPRALVCTHYDTKFFRQFRFVGANDGGSGTGALLELARVLGTDPVWARRFELVFFDGEEAVGAWTATDSLYGSRHYAEELRRQGRVRQFQFGVLWDMIGDRDLTVTLPTDSPPRFSEGILKAADAVGTRAHFTFFRQPIEDDHVPLNRLGIPTIDLIDFDFPAWHTAADTLDQVSAESLEIVGRTTVRALLQEAP